MSLHSKNQLHISGNHRQKIKKSDLNKKNLIFLFKKSVFSNPDVNVKPKPVTELKKVS